ncbi:MAG: sulfur carrier protein ThiS adenylyltransferase ThiF [Candidatus Aminicenantes bacterium]|nr:sulfur carrier protein ThiS adenylyltransferase ThiF [Candidatus Aminicenantes bacterium]
MNIEKSEKIRLKLKESSVGIAGAGGLGSNVAIALARSGIGKLVLVDFDKVEENNLSRQYFFRDQIGKLKIHALKENIKRINPDVKVEILDIKLSKKNMQKPFEDVDVVVEALDSAEIKTCFVEEILEKLPNTPLVAATGVAGYGNSDRIKTIHSGNLNLCADEEARSSEDDVLLAPKVCLMANWQANLVLEILLGEDK